MTAPGPPQLRSPSKPKQASRWPYVATFSIAAVIIAGVAAWIIEHDRRVTLAYWEARQNGSAAVMASRVSDWLTERRSDAQVLAVAPAVKALSTASATAAPDTISERQQLTAYLAQAATLYRYQGAYVLYRDGRIAAQSPSAPALPATALDAARTAAQDGAFRVDLLGELPELMSLSFTAPIFRDDLGIPRNTPPGTAIGVVILTAALADTLVPLITQESVPTRTGETVLVRQDGAAIVYFTPLRHRPPNSPQLRVPFATTQLPSRLALMKEPVFGEFTDYRGVTVLAATRYLPLTGWGLVRKIDRSEAMSTFVTSAWRTAFAGGIAILAIAVLLRAEWQRQHAEILRERIAGAEAHLRLGAIVDSSDDAIIGETLDGIITSWNAGAERTYGYAPNEVLGRHMSILAPSECREEVAAILARVKAGEHVKYLETLRLRKDGDSFDVSLTASPIIDTTGAIVGASVIARDVTERRRAEEALRLAYAYNRSLIEVSLDPLVTIGPDGTITDANAATETVTGCFRAQLIGSDFCDYFTEPERARIGYRTVFEQGMVRDYPLSIRHVSGRVTDVLYNAAIYRNQAGAVQGVFAAARDITELERAEEEVRALNEQLEQRVRERTAELQAAIDQMRDFTYSVSHDLRAPIRHIDGFAQLLRQYGAAHLDERSLHYIDVIARAARHMGQLIDDLLTFARTNRCDLNLEYVDLNIMVRDLQDALTPPARQIIWETRQLPVICADPALMRSVFANLLANAIKFTAARPVAHITVGTIGSAGPDPGMADDSDPDGLPPNAPDTTSQVVFFVRDDGVGFDMIYVHKLFGVFQRLHRGEEFEGTGIGLATVRRIIERHGGRVWAAGPRHRPSDAGLRRRHRQIVEWAGAHSRPRHLSSAGGGAGLDGRPPTSRGARRMTDIHPALLEELSRFVAAHLGLHFPHARWHDLEQGLRAAAVEFEFTDPRACIRWLLSCSPSRSQIEVLAGHLTIGETYFFREPQTFAALQDRLLPELIRARRENDQRLRLWSAGCATGEEAYSLAIMLATLLPDVADWNITILATDINPQALQKAAGGVYTDWSFRATATRIKERFFRKTHDGRLALSPDIKQLVTFSYHNLADENYPSLCNNTNAMDVILCRNVLMYFAPQRVTGALRNLGHSLFEGGWLFVSPNETALVSAAEFVPVNLPGLTGYRKDSAHRQPGAQPAASPPVAIDAADGTTCWRPALDPVAESAGEPPHLFGPAVVAVAESPSATSAPLVEAEALYRQGRYADAADKLTQLISHGQEPAAARALLVRAYANQGKLADALAWCDKALATDPLNVELHYLRATVLLEQGAAAEAMWALRRTLCLEPRFVLAHFALGNLALRAHRSREAVKHFANALALADQYRPDDILPESEGLTAGRLTEIIRSATAREIRHEDRCDAS